MPRLLASVVDWICWAIVLPALVYAAYRSFERSEDRGRLIVKSIVSILLIALILYIRSYPAEGYGMAIKVFSVMIPAAILGVMWAPTVGALVAKPLTNTFDGGNEEVELKPFYFIAEGKRRQGLYEEAIAEVWKQLERFPGDFEGYMKLASIQLENLKNITAAEATLNEFLGLPDHSSNEIVSALNLLADWQLQYDRNPKAAGATLQRIVQLYPDTSLAHAAEQRIAHLGSVDEVHRARYDAKFTVEPRARDVGLRKAGASAAAQADPDAQAAAYVKQLELHPRDTETREKLAVLYAEEFGRLDLATDQLEQLIALPEEPPKHVARWLNLLATLHIKCARDVRAAETALHRIIERFPDGALAAVAVSRLAGLNSELKSGQVTPAKTLGTYEKHIGLKQSP